MGSFKMIYFRIWALTALTALAALSGIQDTFGKGYLSPSGINSYDTLERVSLMFEIRHGDVNYFDIKNHPAFKTRNEKFVFNTDTDLPESMLFSEEGTITWKPSAKEFNTLINNPITLGFHAFSRNGNYIIGKIRFIGVGEPIVERTTDTTHVAASKENVSPDNQVVLSDTAKTTPSQALSIVLPEGDDWRTRREGEPFEINFDVEGGSGDYKFELLEPDFLMHNLDRYGTFKWTPDMDFVSKQEKVKSVILKIRAFDTEDHEEIISVPLNVEDINRPPVVSELPTFYITYNRPNTYNLKKDRLVYDPDGDSIIFRAVLKELPQGMKLSHNGELYWKPSRRQFNYLRANPLYLSFTVEDYPDGAKTIGQLKIEVSQEDLPPQITMIPNKERFEIKEDEELHITFFITDPNGEEDLLSFGFVSEVSDIKKDALNKPSDWQYEFTWTPGYDFIKEVGKSDEFNISFYAIDKESNRVEKNITVKVEDTENLLEKDRILYDQYRSVLEKAWSLILQLNEKEKELEKKYRQAKKGKKNRAITTAALGALTGLSPVIFLENPNGQKITAGIGGTATATIGTLEASSVLGESPSDIMRDLNYVSQKRNDLLVYGTVFASKYAIPISRRERGFQSDLRSLSVHLNLKDIAKLELDAAWENPKDATAKNIRKIFKDFNPDPRFEKSYK